MRRPRVVAHRGASDIAPENTLAAIRAAVHVGADAVEIDVQRTRDGVPVLFHDENLARTTDMAAHDPGRTACPVSDLTLDEVRRLDAGSWRGAAHAGCGVPTLAEALATLAGTGVGLLLEIKHPSSQPGLVDAVADVLDSRADDVDVTVQSFDEGALRAFGRRRTDLPLGLLTMNAPRQPALSAWASAVNPWHASVGSAYVRRAQLAGLQTYVWTANTRHAIRRAADAGVEGIITDRPQRALDLLSRTPLVAG